jgi:histone-lysine N-methyltransferase SUV420H
LDSLKTEKEKDDFRRHLRRYINIYLPDCPFEVASTNRYTVVTHEASVVARKLIKKGETVKYLCGVQVVMTPDEEDDINLRKRDFSIVISSRNKSASLFLGPARFANHDCDANARLMTSGVVGMEIIAARNIYVGDEITVTYGDNYFGEDNCECLCKTCEEKCQNGWSQGDEDAIETVLKASIEAESSSTSRYPITRKRKHESMDSSRTPSATPDLRPVVPKRTPKKSVRSSLQLSSPAQSQLSNESPEPGSKRRRELEPTTTPSPSKRARLQWIKTEDGSSRLNLYATPASSRAGSKSPCRAENSANPSYLALGDSTTVDENEIHNLSSKKKAGKPATDQGRDVDTIVVGPSTSEEHPAIQPGAGPIIVEAPAPRKLKRPSTRLLAKTLSKISKKKRTKKVIASPSTDLDHAPAQRKPGDYVLTPLLLAQPASAWISCKICDGYFVQLDAYFTRSACPRCERHSKLYGYQWPKTDKEGKHDNEERVADHRTVHRFIRPDEERMIRRRDRGSSNSRSMSSTREPCTVCEVEIHEPAGRRSGRIRNRRERLTL